MGPTDDLTLTMKALMNLDEKAVEIREYVVAIRMLLEDDEEKEEEI